MAVLWLDGHCPKIPEISKKRLDYLYAHIKPLMRKDGVLHHVHPEDLVNSSFIWDPVWGQKVGVDLYEHARIETYHSCGYIALFKPSIDEVLAQIPKYHIHMVDYFEIKTEDTVACFGQGDGHRTVVVLYTRTEPHSPEYFERYDRAKTEVVPE